MTAPVASPPAPAAAPAFAHNVACPGCGYNLRGLSRTGRCPECGAPAANAIARVPDPVAAAAAVRVAACSAGFAAMAWPMLGFAFENNPPISVLMFAAGCLFPAACLMPAAHGLRFSTGTSARTGPPARSRLVFRFAAAEAVLSAAALGMWIFAAWRNRIRHGDPQHLTDPVYLLLAGTLLARLVRAWAMFGLCRQLAVRCRRRKLERAFARLPFAYGLALAGVAAALAGSLAADAHDPGRVRSLTGVQSFAFALGVVCWPLLMVTAIRQVLLLLRLARAIRPRAPR